MSNNINKTQVISSLIWKLAERGGTQGISFIVSIILARLLSPEDYGIIALITIFIAIANVFVQSGFNTALIQKKNTDESDFSSVFYLSLFIALILYILLYFTAPRIADFYDNEQLVSILRVLSITLIFGAFNSIQNAYLARKMMFKKLFFCSLGSIIISGTIGIATAYSGWGVWALVAQNITSQMSVTIILWFTVKWRPTLMFSLKRVKSLFSYGSKLLASSLINTLYLNLRSLIIGKIYNPVMLGYYNKGQQFPNLIITNIDGSIQSVMLPALSAHQDNQKRVKEMMRRTIVSSSFLIFPMMIGMAVVAEPIVKVVLTEKWLPAVPFLQIFCISYMLYPIHTANLQAINAIGRSDMFLKLEIIKKVFGLAILSISLQYGVYAIALGEVISGIIASFINAHPNRQFLDYSIKEQVIDIMPSLLISLVMGGVVYLFNFLGFSTLKILFLQIFSGIIIYVGLARIFKIESFIYLLKSAKDIFNFKSNN
jgi:O-antigen/teichoic acid export membrane protein